MTVTIRLFASYAEQLGFTQMHAEFPEGVTVADVLRLLEGMEGAARLPPSPVVAVNCVYAMHSKRVTDGDEVALIPPVAGG